ncbi:hypothetical protein B0J14DRAFT_661295 [Halenospora varia]|nr:hypothetical protein B0J14DRAFT_661295 [Halenospora varia]
MAPQLQIHSPFNIKTYEFYPLIEPFTPHPAQENRIAYPNIARMSDAKDPRLADDMGNWIPSTTKLATILILIIIVIVAFSVHRANKKAAAKRRRERWLKSEEMAWRLDNRWDGRI